MIPRHAVALVIADPQLVLRLGVALFRGLSVKLHRLGGVLLHAVALPVVVPQGAKGLVKPAVRGPAEPG